MAHQGMQPPVSRAMNRELAQKVSSDAFQARYAACDDPWQFATSIYERHRYRSILRALLKSSYGVAYEPGCSVGVLSQQLAGVARRLIATDLAPSAVETAWARCRHLPNVEILCADVATYVPPVPLDLVVFSEIGYYFETGELTRIGTMLARQLDRGGEFVAVHWLGHSEDHVLHGDVVHETLRSSLPLEWIKGERHEGFRIDCWISEKT